MKRYRKWTGGLALAAGVALPIDPPASAGPPFVTDDPAPTEVGRWEVYAFAAGAESRAETEGEVGLDINYGLAPDLQITAVLPINYQREDRGRAGPGDIELAVKYRFVRQRDGSPMPDIAFFPTVTLPTARRELGSGRERLFLPLWLQKDFGAWSLFGGGGYQVNPGRGNRDFWTGGVGLSRAVNERLTIGAEFYYEGAEETGGRSFAGANVGLAYRIGGPFSLLLSGGPGLLHRREEARYTFYAALKLDL